MAVPNTNTFSFWDVCVEIYGYHSAAMSLSQAFTDANDDFFDPAYKGSKNNLLNFRNYYERITTYYSAPVDNYFIANDGHCDSYSCPPGDVAAAVYHMVAGEGAYTSIISQADADQQADDAGQAAANDTPCACYYGGPQ